MVQSEDLSVGLGRQRAAPSATLRSAADAPAVAQRAGPEAGRGLGVGGTRARMGGAFPRK